MHVGIAYLRWRGKRSRHSRRMRNRNFAYLERGPWYILYISTVMPKIRVPIICTRSAPTRHSIIPVIFNTCKYQHTTGYFPCSNLVFRQSLLAFQVFLYLIAAVFSQSGAGIVILFRCRNDINSVIITWSYFKNSVYIYYVLAVSLYFKCINSSQTFSSISMNIPYFVLLPTPNPRVPLRWALHALLMGHIARKIRSAYCQHFHIRQWISYRDKKHDLLPVSLHNILIYVLLPQSIHTAYIL